MEILQTFCCSHFTGFIKRDWTEQTENRVLIGVRIFYSILCKPSYRVSVGIIITHCSIFQDICGIICAILTWGLIIYAEFVVMAVILLPNINTFHASLNMAIFQTLAFLAFASHLRTMFTDPVRYLTLHRVSSAQGILEKWVIVRKFAKCEKVRNFYEFLLYRKFHFRYIGGILLGSCSLIFHFSQLGRLGYCYRYRVS